MNEPIYQHITEYLCRVQHKEGNEDASKKHRAGRYCRDYLVQHPHLTATLSLLRTTIFPFVPRVFSLRGTVIVAALKLVGFISSGFTSPQEVNNMMSLKEMSEVRMSGVFQYGLPAMVMALTPLPQGTGSHH
ncbi:uncharacterized protein LOC113251236 isoform X3 [Ursus arctos]|uniref:uncharacterized protein LOC113251236 isoform X3 n=1 Tax=Ursus arctos TaxID=9644 RepID=UPI002546C3AE|nr:uncharacterized protein LOC113251236 isoform X3 [Ursus arctos]